MEKIRLVHFLCGALFLCLIPKCSSQARSCRRENRSTGTISDSEYRSSIESTCWIIEVPEDSFVRIDVKSLSFRDYPCSDIYLKISVAGMNESYTYCSQDTYRKPLIALNDVNVTYYHNGRGYSRSSSFSLQYTRGNSGRIHAINWLKKRQTNFGWGRNTHRAITALYLTNATQFQGNNMEEEVMVKQLRMRLVTALSRNATDPISVNELSMYLNALTVTCHNDRNFSSNDLLKILADRAFSAVSPSPGAYLTLCNSKWPLTSSNVQTLLEHLKKDTEYQFHIEYQAMTVLALSCMKKRTDLFNLTATNALNSSIRNLMKNQRGDGSFRNPHTTAVVVQALIASGEKYSEHWNVTSALLYLMNNLNSSSVDFLSIYLTLPLVKGKTLTDIGRVHCKGNYKKVGKDDLKDASIDELGGYSHVQFSLYIGDRKDIVHTVYLNVPDNSTAYDVMKMAPVVDPNYKFSYHIENDHVYIYMIAGIANDIEAGEHWHFYSQSPQEKELKYYTASPDQIIVGKNEHLVMWYKTANI